MTDLEAITERAKATGFIKENGTPITLKEFKESCSVHTFMRSKVKRIYFGAPNSGGMLSVFPNATRKVEAIKECYEMLIDIVVNQNDFLVHPHYIRINEKYQLTYGRY